MMAGSPAKITDLGPAIRLPIDDIKPAPDNPRQIPKRAIEIVAESLRRFGWQQPLVVDRQHVLIVGHTRWLAAQHLRLTDCPVIVAEHLTDREVRAYRIADNRTHDFTTWDYSELVNQLEDLAPDFSEVLALADWQSIVDTFEQLNNDFDVPEDVAADVLGGFPVIVVFRDKPAAVAAALTLIDLDGVIDVRHKE